MGKAILTIDDIPQKVTKPIIDYLEEKRIPVVMFVVGENAVKDMETLVYAIKHGVILGNHSYSHPFFSRISMEECIEEITKTEKIIEEAYAMAGVERPAKLFRFPYIDKGTDKKDELQKYLKESGYQRIDDSGVEALPYHEAGWDRDYDITCSYDCQEYNIPQKLSTMEDIMKRLEEGDTGNGSNALYDTGTNIILLHSHDDTDNIVKDYYKQILGRMLDAGVEFIAPNIMEPEF